MDPSVNIGSGLITNWLAFYIIKHSLRPSYALVVRNMKGVTWPLLFLLTDLCWSQPHLQKTNLGPHWPHWGLNGPEIRRYQAAAYLIKFNGRLSTCNVDVFFFFAWFVDVLDCFRFLFVWLSDSDGPEVGVFRLLGVLEGTLPDDWSVSQVALRRESGEGKIKPGDGWARSGERRNSRAVFVTAVKDEEEGVKRIWSMVFKR